MLITAEQQQPRLGSHTVAVIPTVKFVSQFFVISLAVRQLRNVEAHAYDNEPIISIVTTCDTNCTAVLSSTHKLIMNHHLSLLRARFPQ